MPRRHPVLRGALLLLPVLTSSARLHAHSVDTPLAVTQELNPCLTIVRVAATRRPGAQRVKGTRTTPARQPQRNAARGNYDDYKIPAGTPLDIRLRTNLDSASSRDDDPVRAVLTQEVTQDGVELIPAGSSLHGRVTGVAAASRSNPLGRVVLEFHVIEHLDTHSLAMIATRPVAFEATPEPKVKPRDIQIAAGETVTVTLARPLIVHLPRAK
jgi:hypothetical protein